MAKTKTFTDFLDENTKQIENAIRLDLKEKGLSSSFVKRSLLTAVNSTPSLKKLSVEKPVSILREAMVITQLGLTIGADPWAQAFLIPRRVPGGGVEAKGLIGWRGVAALFYQSGGSQLWIHEVYTEDSFREILGSDQPRIEHSRGYDEEGNRGKLKGIYVVATLSTGAKQFEYWDLKKIKQHQTDFAKNSKVWANPKFFVAMARKTVLIALCRNLPTISGDSFSKTTNFQKAIGMADYQDENSEGSIEGLPGTTDFIRNARTANENLGKHLESLPDSDLDKIEKAFQSMVAKPRPRLKNKREQIQGSLEDQGEHYLVQE